MVRVLFLWVTPLLLFGGSGNAQDPNLNILLDLQIPLRDLNLYLKEFQMATSVKRVLQQDVIQVAKENNWQSVLDLLKLDKRRLEADKTNALLSGEKKFEETKAEEKRARDAGLVIKKGDPAVRHQRGFRKNDEISTTNFKLGFIKDKATEAFTARHRLSNKTVSGLPLLGKTEACIQKFNKLTVAPFQETKLSPTKLSLTRGKRALPCDPSYVYRSMDGSCNNVDVTLRGAAFRKFRRILAPDYFPPGFGLRRDVNGSPLPSARQISTVINRNPHEESPDLSIFHMTYGQFVDHDLTATPLTKFGENDGSTYGGLPISCCNPRIKGSIHFLNFGCAPIQIPSQDPFYACHGQTCMEFVRSLQAPACSMGPREQLNEQSSYLDGSGIYGVKPPLSVNDPLRTLADGLLKQHVTVEGQNLLPLSTNDDDDCPEGSCFLAGDGRVNEVLPLTFFHTVWAREHNRIAKQLKIFYDDASMSVNDEMLYQMTRRIVVAEFQHITYKEFLPTVLPDALLMDNDMVPLESSSQSNAYDSTVDSTIANSFAAAAYRFGHSLISDHILKVNQFDTVQVSELSTLFFNPFSLYQQAAMGDIARGATSLRAGKADSFFTHEITDKLFRGDQLFGLDLLALNIQRGRDHGIPGYTKWLSKCGISVDSFEELSSGPTPVMTPENMEALLSVYNNVDDIDLYAGGMSEKPSSGGFIGHTFTCLLTDQFARIKHGDRFWYEEADQAGSFTSAQMMELHRVSLARLFCNNIPELQAIQRFPLRNTAEDNPKISCSALTSSIPHYSLNPWQP